MVIIRLFKRYLGEIWWSRFEGFSINYLNELCALPSGSCTVYSFSTKKYYILKELSIQTDCDLEFIWPWVHVRLLFACVSINVAFNRVVYFCIHLTKKSYESLLKVANSPLTPTVSSSWSYRVVSVVRQCAFMCFGGVALEGGLKVGVRFYLVGSLHNLACFRWFLQCYQPQV